MLMWKMADFIISIARFLLDIDLIHRFISTESYWGLGRTRGAMEKAIYDSTYCFEV